MSNEEWGFEHERVCGFITHFAYEPIYNLISHETHVGTIWQTLESLYASKSVRHTHVSVTRNSMIKNI